MANLASQSPVCTTGSLASYATAYGVPNGNQCGIGILLYSGFKFSASGTGGATLLTASQIDLTPTGQGFGFSAAPGYAFSVLQGQTATYNIHYGFYIDPAPVVAGADLSLDPPYGNVSIVQHFCIDGTAGPGQGCNGTTATLSVFNPGQLTNTIVFTPPALNTVDIETIIKINGTDGPAGFDAVIPTVDVIATPEPGGRGLALCLGGMLFGVFTGFKKLRRA